MIWHRVLIVVCLVLSVCLAAMVAGTRRMDFVNRAYLFLAALVSASLALQVLLMIPCYVGLEEPLLRVQAALYSLCTYGFLVFSLAVVRRSLSLVSILLGGLTSIVMFIQLATDFAYQGFERTGSDVVALRNPSVDFALTLVTAGSVIYALWIIEAQRRRLSNPGFKTMLTIVEVGVVSALALLLGLTILWPLLEHGDRLPPLEGPVICLALAVVYQAVWRHNLFGLTVRSAASSLFDSATDGIVLLDTAGRVRRINESGLRLFGVSPGESSSAVLEEALERLLPGPEVHEELVTWNSDGKTKHLLVSKTRNIEQGVLLGFILVVSDATGLVEAQARLRQFHDGLEKEVEQRAEQLAEAQRLASVGSLARNVAHVLNNQLAVVIGLTESVLDRCEKEEQLRADLEEIIGSAVNAKDIILQMGPETRDAQGAFSAIGLHRVLQEARRTLSVGLPKNISLRFSYDDDYFVVGHPTQLLQVFVNLGKNARDAMFQVGGVLEFKVTSVDSDSGLRARFEHLRPGRLARIEVSDTGKGMSQEVCARAFEPLFTTKPEGEGTGLGLASAKRIVEEKGGAIEVESRLGEGTTVTVYLPIMDRVSQEAHPPDLVYLGGSERLMVVDDEPEVGRATARTLKALGYEVQVCHGSTDALAILESASDPFELVITDQVMPEMSGTELAARLKEARPDLSVILLSGTATPELLRKAKGVGVELVLSKPITRAALARAVRGELDR
jgi:PAS domain S-box-containing protein